MRYLLAALALIVVAIRAANNGEIPDVNESSVPSESAQQTKNRELIEKNPALISSGKFKFDPKDHPPAVDDKIIGTEADGKSTFVSVPHYEATGQNPAKKDFHIVRASDVVAQGLVPVNDGGNSVDGKTVPHGHVSIAVPHGKEETAESMEAKMGELQKASVRVKGPYAQTIVEAANKDTTAGLEDIKAKADKDKKDAESAKKAAESTKKAAAKKAASSGGGDKPADSGGAVCKRDGSFCLIGNRPKKAAATGKSAASTVAKKTANKSMSRNAVTAAATSRKAGTVSKSRLASAGGKTGTGKSSAAKTKGAANQKAIGIKKGATSRKATAGKALGTKKSGTGKSASKSTAGRKQASKTPDGTKKLAGKSTSSSKKGATTKKTTAGKMSNTKKTGPTKKAGASGKGAKSKTATTKKSATGKVASPTKKNTTRQKPTSVKSAANKKPASAGPSKQQTKSSSKAIVQPAAVKAATAKPKPTKKNHRRDLTWNRPRMVYEAVQESKRGLMEESALDQLD